MEVIVPIAEHTEGTGFPNFMYPVFATGAEPVLWNMHFLNIDSLPVIDVTESKEHRWILVHSSLSLSARETSLYKYGLANPAYVGKDVRVNFKSSLHSMFLNFAGIGLGKRCRITSLTHSGKGGVQVLFFVSELRFDLGNQTAILDAAVLPLAFALLPPMSSFLSSLPRLGFRSVKVDDEELDLWKEIL